MFRLAFDVPMVPVGKARARVTLHGTYTPKKTRIAEKTLRDYAFAAMHPHKPFPGPVALAARFIFPIPASWSRAQRAAVLERRLLHTQKPDLDNLVKALKDALNGVAYVDDCQIVSEATHKDWGGVGRIEVVIAEIPLGVPA